MIKESVGCTLPWQALSHASCNSALEHWNENRANYERQEMTLYIKEPEIIVRFLKYQDTHCIMATITVDIVWRIVEEKQVIFFLWCLIQEEKGSQFKMLHRPWTAQNWLRKERKQLYLHMAQILLFILWDWHSLLLNLPLCWHRNSLKTQWNTSKEKDFIKQYLSLCNHGNNAFFLYVMPHRHVIKCLEAY